MNQQAAQRRRVYYALRPKYSYEPVQVPSVYRPVQVPSGYMPPYTAASHGYPARETLTSEKQPPVPGRPAGAAPPGGG